MPVNINVSLATPDPISRGWNEHFDSGGEADITVGASGADHTTIQAAINAATAGAVIGVMDGTYRESLNFATDNLTIKGLGTAKPTITGQESLAGWTQCSTDDASVLGATLGVSDSPVYKTTLSNSLMSVDATALNIYEGDLPVPICQSANTKDGKFFFSYDKDFDRADSFTLNGSNQITAITDASVLSGITATQIGNAFAYVYRNPNAVSSVNITDFEDSTITVDGLLTVQGNTASPDADVLRWNLANCPPNLTQGTYAAVDNGDDTSTIYLYPHNSANLTTVTYAARPVIVDFGTASGITLRGLRLLGTAGNTNTTGCCVRKTNNNTKTSGHLIEHCLVGDLTNSNPSGYGAIYLALTDNCTIRDVSYRNISGAFGSFLNGGASLAPSTGNKHTRTTATKISQAAHRFYTQVDVEFTFATMENCGYGAHSNLWNFYVQCDKVLVYGIKSRDCVGYGTWQASSRIYVGMCDMQTNASTTDSGRILVDQTNTVMQPTNPSNNRVWNCAFPPNPANIGKNNAVSMGDHYVTSYGSANQPNNISFEMTNCIVHGGGISEAYTTPSAGQTYWRDQEGYDDTHIELRREGNIYTATAFWQASGYGWSARDSETVQTTLSEVYTDAGEGDYTAPTGSPILTEPGASVADIVAEAAALFPDFNFNVDADGNSFTPATPKPGPYQRDWNDQI